MTIHVLSMFHFDHEQKQFLAFIHLKGSCCTTPLIPTEQMPFVPSSSWMDEYKEWNRFGEQKDGGPPLFESVQELHAFNETGARLCARLKQEASSFVARYNIVIETFKPLYTNIEVGGVGSWWHLRDMNYDFVVPVQKLPVSDALKSKFMAWRCRKQQKGWFLDPSTREELDQEGQALEEDLRWELTPTIEKPRYNLEQYLPWDDFEDNNNMIVSPPPPEMYSVLFGLSQ